MEGAVSVCVWRVRAGCFGVCVCVRAAVGGVTGGLFT